MPSLSAASVLSHNVLVGFQFVEQPIVGCGGLGDCGVTPEDQTELVFRHLGRRRIYGHGVQTHLFISLVVQLHFFGQGFVDLAVVDAVDLGRVVVDSVAFHDCKGFRNFTGLLLAVFFDGEIKVFAEVHLSGDAFHDVEQ